MQSIDDLYHLAISLQALFADKRRPGASRLLPPDVFPALASIPEPSRRCPCPVSVDPRLHTPRLPVGRAVVVSSHVSYFSISFAIRPHIDDKPTISASKKMQVGALAKHALSARLLARRSPKKTTRRPVP